MIVTSLKPITIFFRHLKDKKYRFIPRGGIEVKGKGLMETYWLKASPDKEAIWYDDIVQKEPGVDEQALAASKTAATTESVDTSSDKSGKSGKKSGKGNKSRPSSAESRSSRSKSSTCRII